MRSEKYLNINKNLLNLTPHADHCTCSRIKIETEENVLPTYKESEMSTPGKDQNLESLNISADEDN